MRYFEFIEGNSNKFWEIHNHWNADKTYIEVRFGKIGSEGRTTKHVYYGLQAGEKLESNLVNQKLKNGYIEKAPPGFFLETKLANQRSKDHNLKNLSRNLMLKNLSRNQPQKNNVLQKKY